MRGSRFLSTLLCLCGLCGLLFAAFAVAPPRGAAAATGPTLSVDAAASRHPISPLIYGMNFADQALAQDLRLPVRRWGGNTTTRYNWQNDMSNHASDYFFENIPEDNPDDSDLPNGSAADRFIEQDRATGAQTLLTVPLIGWVPKRRLTDHPYDCGFHNPPYDDQQSFDQYDDCGDGYHANGSPITGNNPLDTSVAIGPTFIQSWMQHLIGRYGTAAQGGVQFYNLDNEPGLWHETHRDVHPAHPTYNELRDLGYQYAAAIKATDPDALVLGPVQDGWARYFYASYTDNPDPVAQADRYTNHGGTPFVEWYLQQMKAYDDQHQTRLLDYFDLHYYPQADGVSLAPAGNAQTQALRLRTTRSLWDPSYVDESWIAGTETGNMAVQLLPRMRAWVNQNYPGTKLAISEYNWGALDDMNGALAQADVLGIFGREALDLATLWEPPSASQPGAFAFRIYRNYNGSGGSFGDTSVSAGSADQGQLAIYAAIRASDNTLTLMIVNKSTSALTSQVDLAGFTPAAGAQVYRYSAADTQHIVRQPDQGVGVSGFSATFPASSITLVVVPPAQALVPRAFMPLIVR